MDLDFIVSFLYPQRCPVCYEALPYTGGLIHEACHKKLHYVQEPVCLKCGKPIEDREAEYCHDCARRSRYFDSGRAVWIYDTYAGKSVAAFKYKGRREFSSFYVNEVLKLYGDWIRGLGADTIIPVPINRRKRRQRGYNQAELIASGIGRRLNINVDTKLLIRNQWTEPQKTLSPVQRFENLKKAFTVSQGLAGQYRSVLLVDDIFTTGSTVDACAKALKDAGILYVSFLSLCIGSEA